MSHISAFFFKGENKLSQVQEVVLVSPRSVAQFF